MALDLQTPPEYFHTVKEISPLNLCQGRLTIATLSFPYPATSEQRDSGFGCVPLPKLYYELSPNGFTSRTLGPRPSQAWVREPQTLPDGREVENGLLIQKWQSAEVEDAGAGEELQNRRG